MAIWTTQPEKKESTYWEFYERITRERVFSEEETLELQRRLLKSGFNQRRDEIISNAEVARREFSTALGDMKGKEWILAKLDPYFPGWKARIPTTLTEWAQAASEFWKKGIDAAKSLSPEGMSVMVTETTDKLKRDIGKWGTEVLWAVWAIVNADGIEWATGGFNKLSKAIDTVSSSFSTAMKWLSDMLAAFFSLIWLDKLWWSIKGLLGMKNDKTDVSKNEPWNDEPWKDGEKMTNLTEVENRMMRDAAWRHLLRMNSTYTDIVDQTKRAEFDKEFDKYVASASISDKKKFLEQISGNFDGTFSFARIFGYVKDGTLENVWKEKKAIIDFYSWLETAHIIKWDILTERIKMDVLKAMEWYGWINQSNMAEKKEKIKILFENPKYTTLLKEIKTHIEQKDEVSMGRFVVEMFLKTPGILWDFVGEIIPWSALTVKAIDGAFYFGVRTYTALTTQWFEGAIAVMSGMTLEEVEKLPKEKRLLAVTMLQQQGHLTFALAGMAAKVATTAVLMPLYWTQGATVPSAMLQYQQAMWDYEKMASTMQGLTRDLLTPTEYKNLTEFDRVLRSQMLEIEAKLHIVDIFKKDPNLTQSKIHEEIKKRMVYTGINASTRDTVLSRLIQKNGSTPFTKEYLTWEIFKRTNVPNKLWELISQAQWLFVSEQETHAKLAMARSMDALNTVCADALWEGKLNNFWNRLWSLSKWDMSELVKNIKRGEIVLNVANVDDAAAQLKSLKDVMTEIPKWVEHLFSWLNLILVGGMAWNAKEGEKFDTALQGLKSAHPLWAVWVLFTEGTKMKDHQFTNPQYLLSMGIAATFLWMEAVSVYANARNIGIVRAAAQSALSPYRALTSIPRWVVNAGRIFRAIEGGGVRAAFEHGGAALKGIRGGLRGSGRWLAIMAALATAVAIPSIAIAYFDGEKMKKFSADLQKKSLMGKDGSVNWEALTVAAKNWTIEQKEDAIKLAALQYLGENAADVRIAGSTIDIIIQPSKNSNMHMTYGIIDSSEIAQMRMIYEKLGYKTKMQYSTDADKVILAQAAKLKTEWYTDAQISTLNSQIEWVHPAY